jgi:hypothetical protein
MVWQLMLVCHVFSPIPNRLFKTYKKQSSATEREYTAKSIVLANNKEFIINLVKIKKEFKLSSFTLEYMSANVKVNWSVFYVKKIL